MHGLIDSLKTTEDHNSRKLGQQLSIDENKKQKIGTDDLQSFNLLLPGIFYAESA